MKYANCHLHSTFSDAQFTPEQLVLIGKSLGYGALAVTDHETDGGCQRLMRAAKAEGIEAIAAAYGRACHPHCPESRRCDHIGTSQSADSLGGKAGELWTERH